MKIKVTKDNVCIINKEYIHEGEYKINELSFDFSEEYTPDLVINAVFTNGLGKAYQMSIIDNKCHIPAEILADTGQVLLGVYAYKVNGKELELRYSPFPTSFNVISGSYDSTAEESQEITPTQFEQYMQALNDGLNQVKDSISKLDNATKNANDLVDEINKKLENGDFIGPQGPIGSQGEPGKDGTNGIDGVGITTITSGQATEENGNTITPITVEKTDGSSEIFNVSAKNGIDGKNGQNGKDGINGTNGIDGQDGITPNIQIGTVETLEPTEEATVTRTGTDEEPLLNFGIPKGEKGEPGEVTEDTLDNVVPKQTATDSIINVNDALKYKNFDFKVDGAYKQDGEPTPETPVPITTLSFDEITKIGQNLFNYQDTKEINSAYSVDDDGWITISIDNTDGSKSAYYNYYTNNIHLKPNTNYNVFLEVKSVTGNAGISVVSRWSPSQGQFSTGFEKKFTDLQSGKIYNKICTTLSDFSQIGVSLRTFCTFNTGESGSITFRISALEDTSVTPDNFVYKLYKEDNYSIDLQGNENVSLPNGVKDELQIDKEGNVNLIKRVGKILLNSVEKWNLIGDTENYWEYANYNLSDSAKYSYCLSNYFSSDEDNRLIYTLTEIYCRFPKSLGIDVSDSEKFKTWLTNNDVYGYYGKTTPQTISLGKLSDIITTEQGSNTFAINSNIDTQISTTYALDLKKYIDNKIATVSSAVIEQE